MGKDSEPPKKDVSAGHGSSVVHGTGHGGGHKNPWGPAFGMGTIEDDGISRDDPNWKNAKKTYGPAAHEVKWGPGVFTTYGDLTNPFYYRAPKGMTEYPAHVPQNTMNLELHLRDERQRCAGMSQAEREWRKKYVLGQNLHPDEPFYIQEAQMQLNPLRKIYRWPWDTFARKFLYPYFGIVKGHRIRQKVPKYLLTLLVIEMGYYHMKYNHATWDKQYRCESFSNDWYLAKRDEIEAKHPGLIEKAKPPWVKPEDFFELGFKDRQVYLNLGESARPW